MIFKSQAHLGERLRTGSLGYFMLVAIMLNYSPHLLGDHQEPCQELLHHRTRNWVLSVL